MAEKPKKAAAKKTSGGTKKAAKKTVANGSKNATAGKKAMSYPDVWEGPPKRKSPVAGTAKAAKKATKKPSGTTDQKSTATKRKSADAGKKAMSFPDFWEGPPKKKSTAVDAGSK